MMVGARGWSATVVLMGLALPACGSTASSEAERVCAPGKVESCPCPGGADDGVQLCVDDGSGWGPCQCPDGGVGGMSGSGGTAGASGAGGTVTGGAAGDSGGAGASGGTGPVDPSGDCPKGLPGPDMVEVSSPDGTRYCIDSTEVGWDAYYVEFLNAKNDDMSGQPAGCEFNESYRDGNCLKVNPPPVGSPAYCVDWCDAYMWCKWAGKELCGRTTGGTLGLAQANDANVSAWYNVCSNGGTTIYPYGDTYDPEACVSEEHPTIDSFPQPPGDTLTCRGIEPPFDAISDMSGNVWEWVDVCGGDYCLVRGGGWATYMMKFAQESSCGGFDTIYRAWRHGALGFRCCAPLIP